MDLILAKDGDPVILQQTINRFILSNINTSIPGTIQTFDQATQIATVTPNIRAIENKMDGTTTTVQLPDLIQVPCVFPYSTTTGFALTFPIEKGDQCLLIFAQRSIDNWQEFSRVQDPAESKFPRAFSLSDAIAIPGLIPKPNAIQSWQNDGIELRNTDRSVHIKVERDNIELSKDTATIKLKSDGTISCETGTVSLNMNGTNITLSGNGDITLTGGNIILGPVTTIDGKLFLPHIHSSGTYKDSLSGPVTGNSGGVI